MVTKAEKKQWTPTAFASLWLAAIQKLMGTTCHGIAQRGLRPDLDACVRPISLFLAFPPHADMPSPLIIVTSRCLIN
jgi:hypothetical protein